MLTVENKKGTDQNAQMVSSLETGYLLETEYHITYTLNYN